MNIPSWHELFLRHVYLISSKSRDNRTKIGSVLVKDNRVISEGFNGICKGVSDLKEERFVRPEKYFWLEHAERNSVFSCAYFGVSSKNSTCYTNSIPCADCARSLIQAGVTDIYLHKQWMDIEKTIATEKWKEHSERSLIMFEEARIRISILDYNLGIKSLLDGKEIEV